MVSPGYVGEPRRDPGDWFTTGDVGVLAPDGSLTVVGRADDVIITGGENVHPAEVERVLLQHPGVTAARVLGEPDPEWGMRVAAELELDGATLGEVEEWARERLGAAMLPRSWRSVEGVGGKLEA